MFPIAFYINAYNLLVIHQVVKNYPLSSVQDKNGFFEKRKFQIAGEEMSLNRLEKDKLLKKYKDASISIVLEKVKFRQI